ncbi:glycosyltransferase family 4 protein [Streptomyces spinosisporus]|uniref:D-inositol 3-phosphate glycosyltransferase n=1 Tax=Streptomyces spinosisporus TaxID=2927582 RepID=A0ABS9XW56_9ACTN|nr:glycosyltransferase family 4 protein [Streptomyces spinosisporus]MCI3246286.1 glycosyltransferase family 4 protein [Streptomyces spinosisporus]
MNRQSIAPTHPAYTIPPALRGPDWQDPFAGIPVPDVFAWAADSAGCGWYRAQLPMEGLAALGYKTHHSTRLPRPVRHNRDVTIIGQRVCDPDPSSMWQQLAAEGRHLIYEVDDDLFNIDHRSPAAHQYYARPDVRDNIRRNIQVAAAVTVTTEPLADIVAQWNTNVHVIPNAVPDWLIDHQPPQRDDVLTIGWGGSATHNMDWGSSDQQIRRFLQRHPETELHCIGNDYGALLRAPRRRFTPWQQSVEDYYRAIDYHIAVTPLLPHIFNRSKSAVKATEAAALGIPVIASAVRPYEDFIQHGVTGLLVHRDHEWAQHLRALTHDPAMRQEMGNAAREHARQYTISRLAPAWEKALLR